MHTMWKGSISFGLVHIPIKLYSATESKDVKLRYLHAECHTPVKYEKKCPVCEEEVQQQEISRGYEYEKGKFVVLEKDDFDQVTPETNKSIEIIDFVDLKDIDPIYFNRSYFVGPSENGEKAYALLKEAMEQSGKIGVAKITIRSKQHLAVVRIYDKGMVLETIFYPDEVRNVDHVPDIPENVDLDDKELNMAKQLVEQLTTDFEPDKYTDDYRENLMELIQAKITGDEIKVAKEVPETDIVNLMDALQASIDETEPKKKGTTKKGETKKSEAKKGGTKKATGKKTASKKKSG
ncbi:Ku protein [Caldalkalibacillus salinus]|uniref:non-homologous end joining protein Ku n=1 Tax=Caldalkalibacillus salinus TaxID=2803787 RepID=UPI00192440E7|nr:Ku protein [Caldalkalibacillus salinus]